MIKSLYYPFKNSFKVCKLKKSESANFTPIDSETTENSFENQTSIVLCHINLLL